MHPKIACCFVDNSAQLRVATPSCQLTLTLTYTQFALPTHIANTISLETNIRYFFMDLWASENRFTAI